MKAIPGVTRPVMRYHGGKWVLRKWIISHFPTHRVYVEPYGGAASVLMAKPRSFAEVYNDTDEDVWNVFNVLRDDRQAERLRALCELTPWSRKEFFDSYGPPAPHPVERARRTIFRGFAAFGSTHRSAHRTGFRAKAWRRNRTGPEDWRHWPAQIPAYVERLRGVVIECRPALEVIRQQDGPETLFYVDPPYPLSTRSSIRYECESDGGRAYHRNLTDVEHRELADVLHSVRGMVVLSGYRCPLYDELYPDWKTSTRAALADGARKRVEVLWLNPAAVAAMPHPTLF